MHSASNMEGAEGWKGPVFRTRDLTRLYRTGEVEVRALDGVDIELPQGETTVLLGPSGSGKSTFLNIVGGLDRPTGGTVHFRDRELTALGERELTRYRRDHVGFVFQFYNLIPSLTAWENVALAEVERQRAETSLDLARSNYRRAEKLVRTKSMSISQFEHVYSEFQLKSAEVASTSATIDLRKAELAEGKAASDRHRSDEPHARADPRRPAGG